jgi:hypothetical protein
VFSQVQYNIDKKNIARIKVNGIANPVSPPNYRAINKKSPSM